MPAPHYALSEVLIVLAAIWVSWRLVQSGAWAGALGVAIFGCAAGIGVYRFGTVQIETYASLHGTFSQIGGATAMALVAVECVKAALPRWGQWHWGVAATLVAATLGVGLVSAELTTPLFLVWLIVAIIAAIAMPGQNPRARAASGLVMAIFLANALLVRRSPVLGPDLSWHLFHVLIAVWIVGAWWVLSRSQRTG
jgi:hypothetical protein